MTDPEPLWKVMRHAGQHALINWEHVDGSRYAAEIGIIAREIELQFATYVEDDIVLHIVGWLLYEADRAERGE